MDTGPLFRFMVERQRIYRLRESGKPEPWTDDPVLRGYRFCNIFRELDKTSQWVTSNWSVPYADHRNLPTALALARRLNWPPTLVEIGFPRRWDGGKITRVLRQRGRVGEKLVTSAHQVSSGTGRAGGTVDFAVHISEILTALYELKNAWVAGTLQTTYDNLIKLKGFAHFTSYELVTELSHTKWLDKAPDLNTWCVIKEGSHRGLLRVMGSYTKPTSKWLNRGRINNQAPLVEACVEILSRAKRDLGKSDKMFKRLTLRNIEDSLCEFDKYCRVIENGGVGMRRFNPNIDRPW